MQALFTDAFFKDLVLQYGTPLYVYSGDKIALQYKHLQESFDP
ncbi:MAG: diaminopimelate decarboxylase, partial [Chitinophagaceae bacterium]|nr:diaminopimelate decarboxylase [Chitinophagaceae bacterium]